MHHHKEAKAQVSDGKVLTTGKRKDEQWQHFWKQYLHKSIETDFSQIITKPLRSIHAVTQEGFLLKVALFIIAFAFQIA